MSNVTPRVWGRAHLPAPEFAYSVRSEVMAIARRIALAATVAVLASMPLGSWAGPAEDLPVHVASGAKIQTITSRTLGTVWVGVYRPSGVAGAELCLTATRTSILDKRPGKESQLVTEEQGCASANDYTFDEMSFAAQASASMPTKIVKTWYRRPAPSAEWKAVRAARSSGAATVTLAWTPEGPHRVTPDTNRPIGCYGTSAFAVCPPLASVSRRAEVSGSIRFPRTRQVIRLPAGYPGLTYVVRAP